MGRRDDQPDPRGPKRAAKPAEREDRRAAALRANLRRRKAQSRARAGELSLDGTGARRGE